MMFGARELRIVVSFIFLAVLSSACAKEEQKSTPFELRVERIEAQHSFRVTWIVPEPMRALIFTRGGGFRTSAWRPSLPGQRFVQRGGREILESENPAQEFSVTIKDGPSEISGDYPLVTTFSDGGAILFTGHLHVAAINCLKACSDDDVAQKVGAPLPARLNLIPAPGAAVVVDTLRSAGPVAIDSPAQGLMAYFGRQNVQRGAGFRMILDPKLPGWIQLELKDFVPRLIDLNSRRLGRSLGREPLLYLSFPSSDGKDDASHLGAVSGTDVLLSLYGSSWEKRTPESLIDLWKLAAHETFHLWNATLFSAAHDVESRWLYEGSADAFAYLAIRELRGLDARAFAELEVEALNRCLITLSDSVLTAAPKSWNLRGAYDCGATMELVLERALKSQGRDLWMFWSKLFERTASTGGVYGRADFFTLVDAELGAHPILASLRALAQGEIGGGPSGDLESFFISAYQSVGGRLLVRETEWPAWYSNLLTERLLAMALDRDCGDQGYFFAEEDAVRVVGSPSCRYLKADLRLDRVGSVSFSADGALAYDRVRQFCQGRNVITVTEMNGTAVDFPCPVLPARPNYLEFSPQL